MPPAISRSTNTVYQYNANLNAFVGNSMGAVGAPWVVDGIAADPPTASTGSAGSTAQLVQAMAGFGCGGGAAHGVDTAPLYAHAPPQTLLTPPHPRGLIRPTRPPPRRPI